MRLSLRVLGVPVVLLVAAILLRNTAGAADGNQFLASFAEPLIYLSSGVSVAALLLIAWNAWRVWRAVQGGDKQACDRCSMPTDHHPRGRWGPYYKCWGCGANRADRY